MTNKPGGAPAADPAVDPDNPDTGEPNDGAQPDPAATPDAGGAPDPGGEPAADPNAAALQLLEKIQKTLSDRTPATASPAPATTQPSYQQVREKIKEETGWSDAQVDFHLRSVAEANAGTAEKVAWMELKDTFKDLDTYKADMQEELKSYAPTQKADPVLLQKVYYMVKGRKMNTPPPTPAGRPVTPAPDGAPPRRIAQPYPGAVPPGGGDRRPGGQELTGEAKELARRMGVPEDRYVECSKTRKIKDLK
jgi:hypothetical protein